MKVLIAPDFESLLPEHTAEELELLEANVLADPDHEQMPPVIIWGNHNNTIIDGHHQYAIRTKHRLKIRFVKRTFETRDEAMRHALDIQFGRRNMDASQRAMAYAKLPRRPEGRPTENKSNLPSIATLAVNAGVSETTMKSAAKVADKGSKALVEAVESGEIPVSTAAKIADLPKSQQKRAITQGVPPKKNGRMKPDQLWGQWDDAFGKLKRLTGELKRAFPNSARFNAINDALNLAYEEKQKWKA